MNSTHCKRFRISHFLRIQLVKFSVIISWFSFLICNHHYFINITSILIIATSFESSESNLLHHINNMSFAESTSELIITQEEKKTRVDANAFISKSKKRRFIVLKQKKVIQTSEFDYTSSITSIYRSFQLCHACMTFWKFVQLFLFFLQSIFDLLFQHINQKTRTEKINWNALTMMKLRQWIAIRIQMTQNFAKNATIQLFWFQKSFHNSSFNLDRYHVIERHLNVEFNQQMSYNNASWFWKIEIVLNVFKNRLFSFIIFENHFAIDESTIEFHDQISFYTQISVSFYTLWSMIKTFYMTSCCEDFAMISKFTIAMQYNLHMSHVNRANQLRNELTISRFEQVKWTKRISEFDQYERIHRLKSLQSQKNFNHRDRRVFTQKLIAEFLRSSDIIHQSSKCIKSIYCKWSDCSINDLENVKHSFSEMSIYSIVRIVKRLIIVWHVKWVYACHLNVSKSIMIRRRCHTSALINRESEYVSKHLKVYRWFQMNFECNHISVIECLYTIELLHWIIHIYT